MYIGCSKKAICIVVNYPNIVRQISFEFLLHLAEPVQTKPHVENWPVHKVFRHPGDHQRYSVI